MVLSWHIIIIAIGIPSIPFSIAVIGWLLWSTKKLIDKFDNKWEGVNLGGSKRKREIGMPGSGQMLELKIGGTVSSTSSVHPTKETWLNIQASSQNTSNNNATERTTMKDIQEIFDKETAGPSGEQQNDKTIKRKQSISSVTA